MPLLVERLYQPVATTMPPVRKVTIPVGVLPVIWWRTYLMVSAIILLTLHLHLLSMLDQDLPLLDHSHQNDKFDEGFKSNFNYMNVHQIKETELKQQPTNKQGNKSSSSSIHQHSTTTTTTTTSFNNIPVQRIDAPKITTVQCISPQPHHHLVDNDIDQSDDENQKWMYRTCEYHNLCYDPIQRQYIAIVSTSDRPKEFPAVAIGGINPRWNNIAPNNDTTSNFNPNSSEIQKVKWQPQIRLLNDTISDHYFRIMKSDYIFLPFHSMAGHNVGHLIWDDLYAIYTALRLRNYIFHPTVAVNDKTNNNINTNATTATTTTTTLSNKKYKFLFLRHVLEGVKTQLYANCDIRRNKRIQCQQNFQRFLPLFGNVDVTTFFTTKTSQFINKTNNDIDTTISDGSSSSKSSPLICFDKTIVGIGLLTDHGWQDHGWETPSSLSKPPHNLGRGRLFYDYTQFLLQSYYDTPVDENQRSIMSSSSSSSLLAKVPTTRKVPQITFSIESSRDWSRRLNFTNQINALNVIRRSEDFVIKTYRMYELSLHEQIHIAQKETNIFISVCGGGSMTSTFLPRNSVVIVFYHPNNGHDYYNNNVHPNGLPARLDWDLLNNAAHLRVHWLPISNMDTPSHIELFVRLIRHELKMINR